MPLQLQLSFKKQWRKPYKVTGRETKRNRKKILCQIFQALRIDVNNEFEVLETFLEKLPNVMKKGEELLFLPFTQEKTGW